MSTAVAKADLKPIDVVRGALEKMKPQFAMCLPKHLTPDRMMRVALTAIQNTPKLLDCDRTSLYSAVMRAAQLGLEPDGILGQAYLIPYGKTVQFIPGYKGLIDLARRSGDVSNIIAKEVYANDEFTIDWSQEIPFTHKPILDGDRGEIKYFWAMARFKDGGFHWDYMTRQEVEAVRDKSQGWQSAVKYNKTAESPWGAHFIEMGKKTAIRRIAKYLPMSVQRAAVVEDLIEAKKAFTTDQYGDITIEGSAEEVTDEAAESTPAAGKLDAFADKPAAPTDHDPVTGEVQDVADGLADPVEILNAEADWDAFTATYLSYVQNAPSSAYLNALETKNAAALKKLKGLERYISLRQLMETINQSVTAKRKELEGASA